MTITNSNLPKFWTPKHNWIQLSKICFQLILYNVLYTFPEQPDEARFTILIVAMLALKC